MTLTSLAVFETEKITRKFVKSETVTRDDGDGWRDHYEGEVDTRVISWLNDNSLMVVRQGMPGEQRQSTNDYTYLVQGSEGAVCSVYPTCITDQQSGLFPQAHVYHWEVKVKYTPAHDIPTELSDALKEMGFKRKEL